ncbi:MAG: alanine dehydrogenase [Acidobacteriota bacterium]|jgi:alanine dehydrogenase
MIVGIPKESSQEERRVALTPAGVHSLLKAGQTVIAQSDAGIGCGFSIESYREAGATIAFSAEEVFARADLVVKVMPPTLQECSWMGEGKFLFSVVHLGSANPGIHQLLRSQRVIAVGLELIEDADHYMPILMAMSEIAGTLVPQIAGRFLETTHGGRGVMLGGLPGVPASHVVIVGAGTAGSAAARVFAGYGASVTVMDDNLKRLRVVDSNLPRMVNTALATSYNIARYVSSADVVVGAVWVHGQTAPHVITESMVRKMRPGSVIIDLSIDHGGCVETSRPTTLSDPVFKKHGVIHYCVPNIPSSVARTASHALNNVIVPFVEDVEEKGGESFRDNLALRRGVYLFSGHCTHEALAGLLGCEYRSLDSLLSTSTREV